MYGLVNKGIEQLVTERFGESKWNQIRDMAGVEDEVFLSMEPYPDEITYKLVGAASSVLEISANDVLKTFGEYWTLYTSKQGYGDLIKMAGNNMREFLQSLNDLHERVRLTYPALKPPSFICSDMQESSMLLHYHSPRDGLAPLVEGLLSGLSTMFNEEVQIEHLQVKGSGSDHDVFKIVFV